MSSTVYPVTLPELAKSQMAAAGPTHSLHSIIVTGFHPSFVSKETGCISLQETLVYSTLLIAFFIFLSILVHHWHWDNFIVNNQ